MAALPSGTTLAAVHRGRLPLDEGSDALRGVGRDPAAQAQPADKLAVVDREPPEGRFRHARPAAVIGDVAQQSFAHELAFFGGKHNKGGAPGSTTIVPMLRVGSTMGSRLWRKATFASTEGSGVGRGNWVGSCPRPELSRAPHVFSRLARFHKFGSIVDSREGETLPSIVRV